MARFEMTCPREVRDEAEDGDCDGKLAHLIRVHVALSAATSLEDHQRELVDQLARDHLSNDVNGLLIQLRITTQRTSSAAFWIASPTFGSKP